MLGLALVALPFAVVACAPSAPPCQVAGPADADATPATTATATATTAATATSAATPTSTATATLAPTATSAQTPLRPITSEFLRHSYERHQQTQSGGAAGEVSNQYPDTAVVVIRTNRVDEVTTFLAGKGITPLETVNGRPVSEIVRDAHEIVAEIPLSLLPELSQHWVGEIEHANPYYPVLTHGVNDYLVRYQAGLPLDGEFLWVNIDIRKEQPLNNLDLFRHGNGALLGNVYAHGFDAFVPLSLLESLALRSELEQIRFVGGPFQTTSVEQWRERLRAALTPTPTLTTTPEPTPAAGSVTGSSNGATGATSSMVTRSPALLAHNVTAWYDLAPAITGTGVKTGIIDIGFNRWNRAQIAGELPSAPASRSHCQPYLLVLSCKSVHYHGVAISESIYDIASGAELYITSPVDKDDFINAVN